MLQEEQRIHGYQVVVHLVPGHHIDVEADGTTDLTTEHTITI